MGRSLRTVGLVLVGLLPLLAVVWRATTYSPGGEVDDAFAITRMTVQASLEPTGSLAVHEEIAVRFHTDRHGIFRDLPVSGPAGDLIYTISSVQQDGAAAQVLETDIQDGTRLRIGDPDVTIRGDHDYTIDYRIDGLLAAPDDDSVELRWDAIGFGWPTTISAAEVHLALPERPMLTRCVVGHVGSVATCPGPTTGRADTLRWRLSDLAPFQGATVSVGLPPAAVSTSPPAVELVPLGEDGPPTWWSPRFVLPAAAAGLAGLITAWPLRRWRRLRELDLVADTAPPAFRPPTGKPEAHATLVDPSPDTGDLRAASLIRLALAGALRIDPDRSDDRRLVVARGDTSGLDRFDRRLVETLTPADGSWREWSGATSAAERRELSQAFDDMDWDERTGVRAGLAAFGATKGIWFAVLFGGFFAFIGALAAGAPHLTSNGTPTTSPTSIGLFASAFVGIGALIVNVGTGARLRSRFHYHLADADLGTLQTWRGAVGLRRAIEKVEEERFEWAASQPDIDLDDAALDLLPWAVAFGLGDAWLDRFGHVIQDRAAAAGVHLPSTSHLSSMSSVVAAASTPPSSSGSGGSGGGGGGSGGGGGGGGSW